MVAEEVNPSLLYDDTEVPGREGDDDEGSLPPLIDPHWDATLRADPTALEGPSSQPNSQLPMGTNSFSWQV